MRRRAARLTDDGLVPVVALVHLQQAVEVHAQVHVRRRVVGGALPLQRRLHLACHAGQARQHRRRRQDGDSEGPRPEPAAGLHAVECRSRKSSEGREHPQSRPAGRGLADSGPQRLEPAISTRDCCVCAGKRECAVPELPTKMPPARRRRMDRRTLLCPPSASPLQRLLNACPLTWEPREPEHGSRRWAPATATRRCPYHSVRGLQSGPRPPTPTGRHASWPPALH